MTYPQVLKQLRAKANPDDVTGMARFGIHPGKCLGIRIPVLRKLAKEIGKDHGLALKLWASGLHEARILAGMVAETDKTTKGLMEAWTKDFDSWDVCDQVCMNLYEKTPYAYEKAFAWSKRKPEFTKRAGFVLMARLAFTDKTASNAKIAEFFPAIRREAMDERNFVKKAVNWALRQIGKRNKALNKLAIKEAKHLAILDSPSAKWIARDALRELGQIHFQ
ncbi:MAG: DNA alkylation repair protein [Gammaproteobacteria bacterium]|nr:MAG: DNA alkylation repair protein [Gammaproteobacteria bacterium]